MFPMHRIVDAIVHGGTLVLRDLPFAEGQHVRVVVAGVDEPRRAVRTIDEVRALLAGSVERFDDPFEPLIPVEDWEMGK
jgi:hypothetical protein